MCHSQFGTSTHSRIALDSYGFRFYVCNPTTKKFKILPFPSRLFLLQILALNLAFDPSHSPHFKILCILQKLWSDDSDFEPCLQIYESETNTWKPSAISFDAPETAIFSRPVFCKRAIHWYSVQHSDALYFDVDKECFELMHMPQILNYEDIYNFGESRGHIYMITITDYVFLEFDVLELEEDYSAWSVRYHVNLNGLSAAFSHLYGIPSDRFSATTLGVVRAEKEEESKVVLYVFGMVVSYNFSDGSFRKLIRLFPPQEAAIQGLDCVWINVFPFIETLDLIT